jgi:DNA-binding MarR family transcriptional regulator
MVRAREELEFPLEASVGAILRMAHLAYAQDLQNYLASHDIAFGMWFYLRALWEEDGLTQRELSRRVSATEATTAQQLTNMERSGLVVRRRSTRDRRSSHVHLTGAGRALRARLLPYAVEVNATALDGFTAREIAVLRDLLERIRANLEHRQRARETARIPRTARTEQAARAARSSRGKTAAQRKRRQA